MASKMTNTQPQYPDTAVAVTGMACKFAGADSLEDFWDILESGTSMCQDLPKDRFPDSLFERRKYLRNFKGNVMQDVDAFDHKFFKVASREAAFMDPQQRIALQITYQALESSGYFSRDDHDDDESDQDRDIGCFLGACTNEYAENVCTHSPSAFSLTGSVRTFLSGKISHHFGWSGPAFTVDTACASSGTALHLACRSVASGECSAAVAVGTNLFVGPDMFQNLQTGQFTSPTGESKTFDASADGYCRGEGVAVVVLKKLSKALEDGDPIRGVILSTAMNQGSQSNITIPSGTAQTSLYRKALRLADVEPLQVSYVEAHGTGTPVGDPIEVSSIRQVFGSSLSSKRLHGGPYTYMGSLKSNIGHTESTAGLSGLIKVLLMMQKEAIPRQAVFRTINPALGPLEPHGIQIATRSTVPWNVKHKTACVNNYGASGTNVVMVVTEPPSEVYRRPDAATQQHISAFPVSVSAFSTTSLSSYCTALLNFIIKSQSGDESEDAALAMDIACHLSTRRNNDLPYSVNATVRSLDQLKDLLKSTITRFPLKKESKRYPVVMFFPGQTGKMASVPKSFYESCLVFKKHLDECDAVLKTLKPQVTSIFPAIFQSGPHDDIVLLHSILFASQYATAMAWLDCGLKPARLIGHSFGQLTALAVSGVLSLHDALTLVTERALLIKDSWGQDSGSMIAVEGQVETIESLLKESPEVELDIACYNASKNFVLAGSTSSVDSLEGVLKSSTVISRWKRLNVTNAYHSNLTNHLIKPLQKVAEQLTFHTPKFPIETCSEGKSWESATPALVASHIRDPVHFHQAAERVSNQLGICTWVEMGTAPDSGVLNQALRSRSCSDDIKTMRLNPDSSLSSLAEVTADLWKSGYRIQFWPFHHTQRHHRRFLNIPGYQFDKTRHWMDWKELGPVQTVIVQPQEPSKPVEMPLLHMAQKTEENTEFHINTQCDDWRDLCTGYSILSAPVCPTSAILGLVFKAIDTMEKSVGRTPGPYNMNTLSISSPISADFKDGLSLVVSECSEPYSWTFMFAQTGDSSSVFVSGTVSASSIAHSIKRKAEFSRFQRLANVADVKTLTDDLDADSVRGKAVYKSIADMFQVPSSKQGIKEVCVKGSRTAGCVTMSSIDTPSVIETFIQVPHLSLNCLQDHQPHDSIYINTSIGHASFSASSAANTSWALYMDFFESSDSEKVCDIFAFERESGTLSLVLLDVVFTRMEATSLREALLQGAPIPTAQDTQPHSVGSTLSEVPTAFKQTHEARQAAKTWNLDSLPKPQHQAVKNAVKKSNPSEPKTVDNISKPLYDLLMRIADVEAESIHPATLIIDLGIDSLMGMEVAHEIQSVFSVELSVREFESTEDVGSLCKLIASKTSHFSYETEESSGLSSKASKPSKTTDYISKPLYDLLMRIADVDADSISPATLIIDLGIDSLMGMEVTHEIQSVFSVELSVREFESTEDVGSLCKLIASKTSHFSYEPEGSSSLSSGAHSASLAVTDSSDSESRYSNNGTQPSSDNDEEDEALYRNFTSLPKTSSASKVRADLARGLDSMSRNFDVFAKQKGCDNFWSEIYPQQLQLIVAYIVEAFSKMGCDLSAIAVGENLPAVSNLLPKHDRLMSRFMYALRDHGLVTMSDGRTWTRTAIPVPASSSSDLLANIIAKYPHFATEHLLIGRLGVNLAEGLSGKMSALKILFGHAEGRKLLADLYCNTPLAAASSEQFMSFLKNTYASASFRKYQLKSAYFRRPLRILEVGGGTCSQTLPVLEVFAELGLHVEYTFTDISPSFFPAAKTKLHKFASAVKFQTLDITKEPTAELVGRFDLVFGMNVVHATPNVVISAQNARRMLVDGGMFALVEYTAREFYLLDMIFGQLDGWWAFEDHRDYVLLDGPGWKKVLLQAGFEAVGLSGGESHESKTARVIVGY